MSARNLPILAIVAALLSSSLLTALTLAEPETPAAAASAPDLRAERFEDALEGLRRQLRIPGLSAAVVQDQEIVWAKGFGYADVESSIPATPETPYYLASLTKTFASTIIMQLVEEGKIDLDDPISRYGIRIRSPGVIRVRHLLSHTSEGVPGSGYQYNGYRFSHLDRVIEKASGKSFRELLIEKIIRPLGMTNTAPNGSAGVPEFAQVFEKLTRPYTLGPELEVTAGEYPGYFGVSAGLISTVVDMAKYDVAIDANRFLDPETQELAFTPTISNAGAALPYGLGWFTQDFHGRRLIWHYGLNPPSVSSLILKIPDENLTFVVFGNTDDLSRPFGLGTGDVLSSPFALTFMEMFLFRDRDTRTLADVDWEAAPEELLTKLGQVEDEELRALSGKKLMAQNLILRRFRRTEEADRLLELYSRLYSQGSPLEKYSHLPVIAQIVNPGSDHYEVVDFSLEEEKAVRIYAVGEGRVNGMWDFGGIEDVETGELVWTMSFPETEGAGGASKNRRVERSISLSPARYRLHFKTDDSHAFGHWNAVPPDPLFWGIALFEEVPLQGVPETRPSPRSSRNLEPGSPGRLLEHVEFRETVVVGALERGVMWGCALVFMTAWLGWSVGYLVRRFRRRAGGVPDPRPAPARIARLVASLSSLLFSIHLFALVTSGMLEFVVLHGLSHGMPLWAKLLQSTPVLGAVLTPAVLLFAVVAWWRRYWSLLGRWHYSLVALSSVAWIVLLYHWSLLVLIL
ncbi:MAG: beta-lactamase family protein [bacterium]|nr:beta-lactamase family protein [bacterium]